MPRRLPPPDNDTVERFARESRDSQLEHLAALPTVEQAHPRLWWLYGAIFVATLLLSALLPAGCAAF